MPKQRSRQGATTAVKRSTRELPRASAQFSRADMLTLGLILDQLASKLGGLIKVAENAGEVLITSAGAQIASAIEYAKIAYLDALDTTIEKFTNAQKKLIDDITTEINYIEHHVIDELRKIVERGSMALNTVPFSDHFPQLGWYSPSYLAPDAKEVVVEFNGNFFDVGRKGYDPTLNVGGQTYNAVLKTTLRIGFSVPVLHLKPKPDDTTFVEMLVKVPYRKSYAFGTIHKKKIAEFAAVLTLLPPTAGSIVFDTDHFETQKFDKPNCRSGEFIQHSAHDDIPDPIGSGHVSSSPVTPGWFLTPAEVRCVVNFHGGDWIDFGNRSNATTAAWSIATVHHGGGEGRVHFVLFWNEYQYRQVQIVGEKKEDLVWGSSRRFEVPPGGTWNAKYTDFRGKPFDIGSAAFENPYVKISTSGNSVMIITIP